MGVVAVRGSGAVRRAALRRTARAIGAAALVVAGLAVAPVAPAAAAAPCSAVLAPGDVELATDPDVADAVESLRAAGATPWVRVWTEVPDGDLDAAVQTAAAGCPAIAGDLSRLAPEAVVVAVSLQDRQSGIYYGSRWDAALDPWWEAALASDVTPLLQDGDVVGGVVAGLTGVQVQISGDGSTDTDTAPDPAVGGDPVVEGDPFVEGEPFVAGEPFVESQSPAASLSVAGALGVGGLVAGLVCGGVGISKWTTRRRARAGAAAAAALARTAQTRVTAELAALRAAAAALADGLADPDVADVRARVEQAEADAAALGRVVEVQERQYPQAGLAALATLPARAADAGWNCAAARVGEAHDRLLALRRGLDVDAAAVADLGPQLDALAADLPPARARVGAMTEQGFTVEEGTAVLATATADLARATADRAAARTLTAARTVAAARQAVRAAVADAEALPGRRAAVLVTAGAVADRLDAARAAAAAVGAGFARLRDDYDASCWSDLATAAEGAPGLVERSTAGVEDAQVAASMRAQRWADAESAAAAALDAVERVTALAGTVTERLAAVEAARRTLAARRDLADALQQDAARYVRRHRRDVPADVVETVSAVGLQLREVSAGLAAPRPAWLRLEGEVARAEQQLTAAVAAARTAHERAERRRRDAELRSRNASMAAAFSSSTGSSGSSGFSGSSGSSESSGGGSSSW